jgi:hypothetical protein
MRVRNTLKGVLTNPLKQEMFWIPAYLDVLEGVQLLHSLGFTHGRLSAQNIFFYNDVIGGATNNFLGTGIHEPIVYHF